MWWSKSKELGWGSRTADVIAHFKEGAAEFAKVTTIITGAYFALCFLCASFLMWVRL
jgi:hypothetical protein